MDQWRTRRSVVCADRSESLYQLVEKISTSCEGSRRVASTRPTVELSCDDVEIAHLCHLLRSEDVHSVVHVITVALAVPTEQTVCD